ncbi:hypothetical protein ALMP_71980 [Streptomyces sp. A012304]|nr:hypothetical protein ALMP_71980 [Streptomyces sp. A012304]
MPGLRVESGTVARDPYELRVHRVIGAPANSRVTQMGWVTGPDDAVVSALHGLHGWDDDFDSPRAPQDTAYPSGPKRPGTPGNHRAGQPGRPDRRASPAAGDGHRTRRGDRPSAVDLGAGRGPIGDRVRTGAVSLLG